MRTTHTSRSHSRVGSHVSQRQDGNKALQQEIDDLKKKLRRTQRSRTPPSETFSHEEEHHHKHRHKSPSPKGLGNDAMSKALDRISKSPFTCKIEGAKLPRRFHQPTFTIYNGRMDPVKHVSQFNQMMTVHSKDKALLCKVFPSSLGLVAMRWYDGLKPNSIGSFKQLT